VEAAEKMPLGAEDLLFLPYLSGERTPHLDSRARGTFVGLTARHADPRRYGGRGLFFGGFAGDHARTRRACRAGTRHRRWDEEPVVAPQLQAEVYGVSIHRTTADEGPAYGAALLSGV
jgi:xylulokinase